MDGSRHILVVDDDQDLRKLLTDFLAGSGFRVSTAANGLVMAQVLDTAHIDLIVLDIMLPGEDGLSLCRRLRATGHIPIVMLTAMGGEVDRIVGLEMGADDYLPKPFSTRELLARIRSVLRRATWLEPRTSTGSRTVIEFAGWQLDVMRRQLHSPVGALVDLRAAEFDVLLALVERPNRVLTRDQLLDLARGRASTAFDRSIDVHISRLRHRIEEDPKQPSLIKTVRSGGYMFAAPVRINGQAR